ILPPAQPAALPAGRPAVPRHAAADGRPRRPGRAAAHAQVRRRPAARRGQQPRAAAAAPAACGHPQWARRRQAHRQGHPGGHAHLLLHCRDAGPTVAGL
ncbi:hypothetical protein Z043-110322, partial [Arapaima gigas]